MSIPVPVAHPVAPRTSDPETAAEAGPALAGEFSSGSAAPQNMPPADPGRSYEASSNDYVAVCWGCGQSVSLPLYAAVFRCGYCEAITYDYDSREAAIWIKPQKLKRKWVRIRDIVTVLLVLTLISVIITGCGVWAVFPLLFPTYSLSFAFHSLIVAFVFVNTVFNFLCASLLPAGPVEPLPFGSVEVVRAGSLADCSLCQQCSPPRPKPTRAHHCRQCGDCVQDMDHHCPFIGNCVGQSNQRHFMVFLVFASLSCLYAATMASLGFSKFLPTLDFSAVRQRASDFAEGPSIQSFFYMLPHVFVEFIFCVGLRGGALLYIFGISLGTAICTGVLLFQQLKLIFEGVSYIDSLKKKKGKPCASNSDPASEADYLLAPGLANDKPTAGMWGQRLALLRGVFGTGSMWTWLLPTIRPPKGSRLDKKHRS